MSKLPLQPQRQGSTGAAAQRCPRGAFLQLIRPGCASRRVLSLCSQHPLFLSAASRRLLLLWREPCHQAVLCPHTRQPACHRAHRVPVTVLEKRTETRSCGPGSRIWSIFKRSSRQSRDISCCSSLAQELDAGLCCSATSRAFEEALGSSGLLPVWYCRYCVLAAHRGQHGCCSGSMREEKTLTPCAHPEVAPPPRKADAEGILYKASTEGLRCLKSASLVTRTHPILSTNALATNSGIFQNSHVVMTRALRDRAPRDHHPSPQHTARSKGAIKQNPTPQHSPEQVTLPPACSGGGKSKLGGGFSD